MPTKLNFSRFAFLVAAVGLALVIVLGAPMRIPAGWDKAAHFVAFSLPERVSDAKDFLVDLCAALATGALLFMQRKPLCAESSPR